MKKLTLLAAAASCAVLAGCSSLITESMGEKIVNNSRLKSKAFIYRNCKAIRHWAGLQQPLSNQLIAQSLQIPTCIQVAVRTETTVRTNKTVLRSFAQLRTRRTRL